MRINAINQGNYMSKGTSFKHTAVPYPEYEHAYYNQNNSNNSVSKFADRISALFTPDINEKSQEIKNNINRIYYNRSMYNFNNPNSHLLSVFA